MDIGEREAVLSLVPYFSPWRVVVDVGSNKGEWSDLLINNTDEHYLFEPNKMLFHYTQIKYAALRHVKYQNIGLAEQESVKTFYQYHDEHNGQSGIYLKPFDLPYTEKRMRFFTMDGLKFDHIDFLKIDVEGAEWEVLKGAEQHLKEKRIKFIQIETGHQPTGEKITELVTKYDYMIYRYDDGFKRAKIDDSIRENLYIMQEFTEYWNSEFIKNTKGMKVNLALEIGAFEGLTTCHICDFLLNEGGRVVCVDPLADEYLVEELDEEAQKMNSDFKQFKGQYDRFIRNTKGKPVELKRMTSREALPDMHALRFDFIYIDGDHREGAVYEDAELCWKVLAEGGHMLFDDYGWASTKKGVNKFIKGRRPKLDIIINDYQLMIRKKHVE